MFKHSLYPACMVALLWSCASYAQQNGSADGAAASNTDVDALPVIVVTAQRRAENGQSVPISISSDTAAELQAAGVQSTTDLGAIVPGLTIANTAGLEEPRIRGVGTASAGAGIENSVATYIDGVYIASSPASLFSLNNIDHVEVLKGPQGTLFGRNATGGLIQLVTKDPSFAESGQFNVGYGDYQTSRSDVYATSGITDKIAADIAVSFVHQGEGYGRNFADGTDLYKTDRDLAARSKWLMHIADATTVRVAFDFEQQDGSNPSITALSGTRPTFAPAIVQTDPWNGDLNLDPFHREESGGASVRLDQDLGALSLVSISAYRRLGFLQTLDIDTTPLPAVSETYDQQDRQVSQEFQLVSNSPGPFKYLIGAYYFDLDSTYEPLTLTVRSARTETEVESKTESIAAFAQGTYQIDASTALTGGLRYTNDERRLAGDSQVGVVDGAAQAPVPFSYAKAYDTPTWRVALDHHFNDTTMAYISENRGYRSGGFSAQSPTAPAFNPEYLDAYEIGVKSDIMPTIRLNGEAFYYDYRSIQVNTYVNGASVIYNGARAKNYGVDLDLTAALYDGLTLKGGLEYIHDRFSQFPNAVVAIPQPNGTVHIGEGSATGNRLPFTPDLSVVVGLNYKHRFVTGPVSVNVNELYSTEFYAQPDNVLRQPAYHMVNASIQWSDTTERFAVTLWGDNLANYAVVNFLTASTTGDSVSYQAPRTYGIRLGVKF
jgi:outer membrane receptor protein involved in Fe transport